MRQRADQQLSDALRREVELHRKAVREAPAQVKTVPPREAVKPQTVEDLKQVVAGLVRTVPRLSDAEQAEISARERAARGGSG